MLTAKERKIKITSSQSGQGILEVIVTIGIGTIMILALVVLSIRSNRASDFSKASSQASSLAEEGIEVIKNMLRTNTATSSNTELQYGVCDGGAGTFRTWDEFWSIDVDDESTIPSCTSGATDFDKRVNQYGRRGVLHVGAPFLLHFSSGDAASDFNVGVGSTTFVREVRIADTPTGASSGKSQCNFVIGDHIQIKQFTVIVSWRDSSGIHNQTQTVCLRR